MSARFRRTSPSTQAVTRTFPQRARDARLGQASLGRGGDRAEAMRSRGGKNGDDDAAQLRRLSCRRGSPRRGIPDRWSGPVSTEIWRRTASTGKSRRPCQRRSVRRHRISFSQPGGVSNVSFALFDMRFRRRWRRFGRLRRQGDCEQRGPRRRHRPGGGGDDPRVAAVHDLDDWAAGRQPRSWGGRALPVTPVPARRTAPQSRQLRPVRNSADERSLPERGYCAYRRACASVSFDAAPAVPAAPETSDARVFAGEAFSRLLTAM